MPVGDIHPDARWHDAVGWYFPATPTLPQGRPYDGAIVNSEGELVIPCQKPFVETWES